MSCAGQRRYLPPDLSTARPAALGACACALAAPETQRTYDAAGTGGAGGPGASPTPAQPRASGSRLAMYQQVLQRQAARGPNRAFSFCNAPLL
jgi:hypothetical protein